MRLPPFLALATGLIAYPALAQQDDATLKEAMAAHDGSEVLATVDGQPVRLGDAALVYSTLPDQMRQATDEQVLEAITEQLISETLLRKEAEDAKLSEDPAVKARVDAAIRSTLAEAYIARELRQRVTDEKVRAEYDSAISSMPEAEEIRARHILVETKEEADDVVSALEGGADFAELAAERSTGPSGAQGGDLGYFGQGDMVPAFEAAAFELEPGAVSEPVETQFGWHVIKLEDRRNRQPPPFEAVEGQLRQQMVAQAAQEIIEEARAGAEIERPETLPPAMLVRVPEMFGGE